MCLNSPFAIGIIASIWTVVQTSIHIIWAICGFYFYICKIKPSYYGLVILYLTYFYKDECGNITLKCDEMFETQGEVEGTISRNLKLEETDEGDVYDIIQAILDKGQFPRESSAAYRTHIYFHFFIVSDAAWIISAFLLFAGTCFQIKKYLSLIFYFPWIIISACIILLDVVSSVHFGLDVLKIHNFTSWLKFIGVENYEEFSEYNKHHLSYIIPQIPALFLCVLFSRALLLWIYNIVLFVQVSNAAVLAFQDNLDGNNGKYQSRTGRSKAAGQDANLDTSASRIRNWQLFYGTVDSNSNSSKSSEKDVNSNNTMKRTSTKVKIADSRIVPSTSYDPDNSDSYERYVSAIRNESLKMRPDVTTYYHQYTDVAESFDNQIEPTGALGKQMPLSYFKQPDERFDSGYNIKSPNSNGIQENPDYNLENDYNMSRISKPIRSTASYEPKNSLKNFEYFHGHRVPDNSAASTQTGDFGHSPSNSEFISNHRGLSISSRKLSTNL